MIRSYENSVGQMTDTVGPLLDCQTINQSGVGRDDSMLQQVRGLLAKMHPDRTRIERRKDLRHPFPFLVEITPVDIDGVTPQGETVTVVGKDLTDRGVGFFHQDPMPFRRAIVSFENGTGSELSLLIDLSWCRFTRQGWYDSGGRFLKIVQTSPAKPRELPASA